MTAKTLLYFGCIGRTGHHLWVDEYTTVNEYNQIQLLGFKLPKPEIWPSIDCGYTPKGTVAQGAAKQTIVDQFHIISWHDYTVDKRANSNSAFIGVGYESCSDILLAGAAKFPSVVAGQIGALVFVEEIDAPIQK